MSQVAPDDKKCDWDILDSLVRDWINEDYDRRLDENQIAMIESEAGFALSKPIIQWCGFALAANQISSSFSFRDNLKIHQLTELNAVSLLLQLEADFYWAIENKSLEQFDPPVTSYYLDYDKSPNRFVLQGQWTPTISSFAFDYLLAYLHLPGGGFDVTSKSPNLSRDLLVQDFGEATILGHLELFISDNELVAICNCDDEDHWHNESVLIHFRQPTPMASNPKSIQVLFPNAHLRRDPCGV